MKKKLFLVYILIIYRLLVLSQNNNINSFGARSTAMANTSVTLIDACSINNNQAGLGFINNSTIIIHHENKYYIKGLSFNSIAGIINIGSGSIGLKLNYLGFSYYNNIETGISYGQSFGKYLSIGLQLNYLHTQIWQHYGNTDVIFSEIGIITKPIKNLIIGVHIYNPTMSNYNHTKYKEYIPTILKLGTSYNFNKLALLNVEIVKDIDYPFIFRTGIEFKLITNFVVRAGVSSNSSLINFGIGYKTKGFNIDVAFSYHSYLGYSPFITLYYNFK